MTMRTKTRIALSLLGILAYAAWAFAQQQAPAEQGRGGGRGRGARARKVVLAWADTRNGIAQHDSTSHALALIERLGYESGMWDPFIRTESNTISYHPLTTTGQ